MPVNDFQSDGLQKAKREAAAFARLVETSVLRGGRVPTSTTAVDRAIDQGHVAERLYKHFLTQPPPPLIQALRSLYALEKAVRHKDDAGAQAAQDDVRRAVAVLKRSVKSARVRGKGIPKSVGIYRRLNADVSGIFFNARRGNILTVYKHLVGAEQWLSKLSQEAPAARAEMKKLKQLLSQIRQEVAQGADSEQLFEYARQAQRITYHMKGKMRGTGKSTRSIKARSSVSVLGNAILGMLRKARSRGLTVRDVERVMDRTTYIYEMYTLNGEPEPPALRTIYNILPALHRALQKRDAHAASRAMTVLETAARYLTRLP